MKRATSLLLTLALVLTLMPGSARAASAAYGSDVWLRDTVLQDGPQRKHFLERELLPAQARVLYHLLPRRLYPRRLLGAGGR